MLKGATSRFDRLRGSYFTRFVAGVLAISVVVMGSMIFVLANIAEGSLTTATSDGVQSVAQTVCRAWSRRCRARSTRGWRTGSAS